MVCEEWKSFYNFYMWWKINYIVGCELDKDMLIHGNTLYSPSTCLFIPQWVNKLLNDHRNRKGDYPIGVYYETSTGKYKAQISKNGKRFNLGRYETPELAFEKWKLSKLEYINELKDSLDKIDKRLYNCIKLKIDKVKI